VSFLLILHLHYQGVMMMMVIVAPVCEAMMMTVMGNHYIGLNCRGK
jgi:hypothetical protein